MHAVSPNQLKTQPTIHIHADRLALLLVQWVPNRGARMALALCITDEVRTYDPAFDRVPFLAAVAGMPTAREDSD